MWSVSFVLVREGTSDDGLVPHLRTLILESGASEALGVPVDYPGSTRERLARVLKEHAEADIVFVHRDADSRDAGPRYLEIKAAAESLRMMQPVVGVVPIQAMEAWLLTSEQAVRDVVGKPNGREPLGLPDASRIEQTHDPKTVLRTALLAAEDARGRRRAKATRLRDQYRTTLLERLELREGLDQLASWRQLKADITAAMALY